MLFGARAQPRVDTNATLHDTPHASRAKEKMATKREVLACLEQSQLARLPPRPATARAVPGLAPALHAYQAAALEWMLQREQRREVLPAAEALLGGTISDVRGGVLADEMGLGKTVTVADVRARGAGGRRHATSRNTRVALRLGGARLPATTLMEKPLPDPPKDRGGAASARCASAATPSPTAWSARSAAPSPTKPVQEQRAAPASARAALHPDNGLVRSRATLVVCPAAIAGQWKGELARHAPSLTGGGVPGRPGPAEGRARARAARWTRRGRAIMGEPSKHWETAYAG